ncbi:MAG TPA: hypothetical protein PLP26_06765 [Ilumatobacteraceae bacterium]|nr:hypothetical protein [Ilumatobacteraceae bacterium]
MADRVWQVRTPSGRDFVVDDFAIDVLNLIAESADTQWWALMRTPHLTGAGVKDLYLHACALAGDEVPDPLTGRILDAAFTQVDDDLPDEFEDGLPKAEADQETTSSSGSQTDTDGRPTK